MAFQRFETKPAKGSRNNGAPTIAIASSGQIIFNRRARLMFELEAYSHCVLYFDPDTRRVGIELSGDEAIGMAISYSATGSAFIAGRSFLRAHNLRRLDTTRHRLTRDEESGLLVFDPFTTLDGSAVE